MLYIHAKQGTSGFGVAVSLGGGGEGHSISGMEGQTAGPAKKLKLRLGFRVLQYKPK